MDVCCSHKHDVIARCRINGNTARFAAFENFTPEKPGAYRAVVWCGALSVATRSLLRIAQRVVVLDGGVQSVT